MQPTDKSMTVKDADWSWLSSYFTPTLVAARAYKLDAPVGITIKLDQNESPWDWPDAIKDRILAKVKDADWNRYPDPMAQGVTAGLSKYLGVPKENILTSSGSNHLITVILEGLAKQLTGKLVITRPSFPLFESHAQYLGIPYETWDLDETFQYAMAKLPKLSDGSMVIIASPNNPTGTSLPKKDLRDLLSTYPKVLFLADEAYYEFDDDPYTDLLSEFGNLLILRTLSKTMGAAGVRLGYALGSKDLIGHLGKLRVPFLLNHFTLAAAEAIFEHPEMGKFMERNVQNARSERNRMFETLVTKLKGVEVFNSKANFLLLRWPMQDSCQAAYESLMKAGIQVRNISAGPGLKGCLRVTIGLPEENDAFVKAIVASHRL
ncbi:MAG: aminotransferase class I/II-fold pyridoxal phosphate-dependent enzyme [Proteobacteria bacterium]|nr:MAG: aminotransferase class I/II-fold pyridoxal phosphate-dependent enzyme [Pseudomonadota bacterium]